MTLAVLILSGQLLQRSSYKGKFLLWLYNTHASPFSLFLCLVIPNIFCRPKRDLYEHFFWQ